MKPIRPPAGQPGFDELIRSDEFKEWMLYVEEYARRKGLDKWATCITLAGLRFGIPFAKRYAGRRSSYRTSRAWSRFEALIDQGLFHEDGIVWTPGTEPWESDPVRWLHTLIDIASGGSIPVGFPSRGGRPRVLTA